MRTRADRILCTSGPFTLKGRCIAGSSGFGGTQLTIAQVLIDTSADNAMHRDDYDFDDADGEFLVGQTGGAGTTTLSVPVLAAHSETALSGAILVGANQPGGRECAFAGSA